MTLLQRLQMASCQLLSQRMGFVQHVVRPSTARTLSSSSVKPFEEVPGPSGIYQLPVIGSILHFKPFTNETYRTFHCVINSLFNKYGPIFKCKFGETMVFVSDPKNIETVFQNEGKYPRRPIPNLPLVYTQRNNLRLNLIQQQDEGWYALRVPISRRLLKVNSAHYYLPEHNAIADDFVDRLTNPNLQPEQVVELFFQFAAECIGVVCFNKRFGFLEEDVTKVSGYGFLKAAMDATVCFQKTMSGESVAHRWYRNKVYRLYEQSKYVIKDVILDSVRDANSNLEEKKRNGTFSPDEPNLLNSLLTDNSLVEDDVINLLDTLYTGGTDSTGKTIQAFLYNLAINPDKQEKLREEILGVLGNGQMVTAEALASMSYLKAALTESFRLLFPFSTGLCRILPNDVVLSGYRIPAQTIINMYNIKTCKDYFPDSDEYIPERWRRTPGGGKQTNIHRCAVLPFGFGARSCVGRRFAEQEIYLAIIKTLQKFKVDVAPENYNTKFLYELFITPETPLKFKFTPLSK